VTSEPDTSDSEELPPEIEAVVEEGRRHPERRQPRPERTETLKPRLGTAGTPGTPGSERQERIWRCYCGADHFLSVIRYPGDPEGCLSLIDNANCRSLRCRAKAAWGVLVKGRGFGHWGIEIILRAESARELIEELQEQGAR
jgi:hypothetical protein